MSHRKKFMGLGDPNITAAFQRICGINLRDAGAKESVIQHATGSMTNGTVSNGYADQCVTGALGVDSGHPTSLSNGCDSLLKTAGKNGHSSDLHKRIILQSNNHSTSDSDESQKKHKLQNGFSGDHADLEKLSDRKKCNGVTVHSPNQTQSGPNSKVHTNGYTNQIHAEEAPCPEYSIDNYLLYYIFSFGASLGNEVFYILFFSCTLWNFDLFVARKMLLFWCTVMYIGQAAKDVIRWPRPDSPPVVHLEQRYELEYGMPSTHAMVGVAIPFGMLFFMLDRYEFNLILGVLFCVNWSILVSFSRVYLGMHSALDILAGLLFAFVLMAIATPFVDYMDMFLMSHPYALPCLVGIGITLCLLYPTIDKWSTARGDTTLSIAVFSGIYAGLWLTRNQSDVIPIPDSPPFVFQLCGLSVLFWSLVREIIGVFFIVLLLTFSKFIVLHSLCRVFRLDPKDPESKKHLVIELPYKYVSYFTASVTATYLMPMLFDHLNIQRPSFYSELFLDSVP